MLQQTQVATVIPYYERFMDRFPSVQSLADAKPDDVLALWSGLGYYARARNLHHAAGVIVVEHAGELPQSLEQLIALPGIGRSTAAAILALSRNQRHAILDGNVKRVLARFHGVHGWPGSSAVQKTLWEFAEQHTPTTDVAIYTQAIMDLGATLCTRGEPNCVVCPVASGCVAKREGIVSELPTPRPKRAQPKRSVTVLIVQDANGDWLLERRPASGIWGGLLSLPELGDFASATEWCQQKLGHRPIANTLLAPIKHSFTHFDLTLAPVFVELGVVPSVIMEADRWLWYNSSQVFPGGVAAPIAKLLRILADKGFHEDSGIDKETGRSQRQIA